ncbi:MAG: hypothetical protein QGI83_02140 [Candidatus Latescibacteria bacterium]|nr:hypothetical protein [Candidatus Latescibacterota bacterium]
MRALILTFASLMLLIPHRLQAGEGDPVLLRYKHPKGQQTVYKIKRAIDLEMDKLRCQALFEHKCTERLTGIGEDGTLSLSVLYENLNESLTVGGNPVMRSVYALLADRPFGIDLRPWGILAGFTPPNLGASDIYDRELLDLLAPGLELYNGLCAPVLPEEPVGVGDTWTAEREYDASYAAVGRDAKLKVKSTFEVKKAKKQKGSRCFEIEEKLEVTSLEIYVFGDQVMSAEGTGTGEAKFLFDYEQGLIRKYDSKFQLKADAEILRGIAQEVGAQKSVDRWAASSAADLRSQKMTGPAKIDISSKRELKKVQKVKE